MAASPLDPPSFFAAFLTSFFLGAASVGVLGSDGVVGVSGVRGSGTAFSDTEDSIWAAVVALPLGLTPICASDTGGVGS